MIPDTVQNDQTTDLVSVAADVVAAYVSNNTLAPTELPALVAAVHGALASLGRPGTAAAEKPVPHMPIKKTVTPDYLVSLEDGRQYRTLKRHLTGRGLTPAQYREKWGLPADYPMAAPSYSAKRSELARANGLGAGRRKTAAKAIKPDPIVTAPAKKGAKKGTSRKAASARSAKRG